MPRVLPATSGPSAYDLDLANLLRLRTRLIADQRVSPEDLKPLLAAIDIVAVVIRPFMEDQESVNKRRR